MRDSAEAVVTRLILRGERQCILTLFEVGGHLNNRHRRRAVNYEVHAIVPYFSALLVGQAEAHFGQNDHYP